MKLKDIAVVQMGFSFRSRLEPEKSGDLAVIQMRDITERGLVQPHLLMTIHSQGINQHHFVKRQDLVFRSRGKTTTAAIIDDDEIDRAIVVAPLLRIRVTNDNILPIYLCWFINQPSSQAFLHSRATGTAMVMIGISVLHALEVPVPSLADQKKIIDLVILADRERELMAKISIVKKYITDRDLMCLATHSEPIRN
ncbi:restriction endonuclease subunit S [Candidatus Spongiihabitans sp.]|uniref:restriction endonuclease subunit S n=1 Tax=Candidatus Spongiihabitans sp. TaxID=3101308 RepID=UPI003C7CE5E4